MDHLTFDGVPLPMPLAPAAGDDSYAPIPAGRTGASSPEATPHRVAVSIAEQMQRAHASVLTAHQAISDWQLTRATRPERTAAVAPVPRSAPVRCAAHDRTYAVLRTAAAALRDIAPGPGRITLVLIHEPGATDTALRVRRDGDRWEVLEGERPVAGLAVPSADGDQAMPLAPVPRFPPDRRPLARTAVSRLSAEELEALAADDIARVLGPAFDQGGLPPEARPMPWPPRLLSEVTRIEPRGGRYQQGLLHAISEFPTVPAVQPGPDDETAAWPRYLVAGLELLRVYAFHQGLHLCLPGARAVPLLDSPVDIELTAGPAPVGGTLTLEMEVVRTEMVPRPHLIANCRISSDQQLLARVHGLGIGLQEAPGANLASRQHHGIIRKSPTGEHAEATELHMAHVAEGDHQFFAKLCTPATATVRPRLPRGDMLMISRILRDETGPWREYRPGSWGISEYDVPANPWYRRESNGALPQFALMEMALQPAGLLSAGCGTAEEFPDEDLHWRNLEGTFRLLRDVDLDVVTVAQHATLRSHTLLPGGLLHRYGIELSLDGDAFYTGSAVHGAFTPALMAYQRGLDGHPVPTWLDRQPTRAASTRRLDLREDTRLGHGRLAQLEQAVLVPDGGTYGRGYVLCEKPVDPDDWFFDHHFLNDPVLPGSAGVQMLYQAVHAFCLYSGITDHLPDPQCDIALGEEVRWAYRGQILREHQRIRGEVHIRKVHRDGRAIYVHADGSVWRDDLRIYQVDNIAIRLSAAQTETPEDQR